MAPMVTTTGGVPQRVRARPGRRRCRRRQLQEMISGRRAPVCCIPVKHFRISERPRGRAGLQSGGWGLDLPRTCSLGESRRTGAGRSVRADRCSPSPVSVKAVFSPRAGAVTAAGGIVRNSPPPQQCRMPASIAPAVLKPVPGAAPESVRPAGPRPLRSPAGRPAPDDRDPTVERTLEEDEEPSRKDQGCSDDERDARPARDPGDREPSSVRGA
jgi:hypothetical protein